MLMPVLHRIDRSEALKALARRSFKAVGLTVHRYRGAVGDDPFEDMNRLAPSGRAPLIIDVGANLGQSIVRFKAVFPNAEMHSFEPSPSIYAQLCRNTAHYSGVHLNNCGVGAEATEAMLLENSYSGMSSLLAPGRLGWGEVTQKTPVRIETLDGYCAGHDVGPITILKTDTQGFDFDVLKGSVDLIVHHRIQMVYTEVIFSEMYEGLPHFDEILLFLREHGFRLVSLYNFHFQEGLVSWADALFVDPAFEEAKE
jgi:FkbM family methyltransferase